METISVEEFVENHFIELFDLFNPELKPDESAESLTDSEILELLNA